MKKKWNEKTIQALRKKYKLSQTELAIVIGNQRQQTISHWEVGLCQPNHAYSQVLDMAEDKLAWYAKAANGNDDVFKALLKEKYNHEFTLAFGG